MAESLAIKRKRKGEVRPESLAVGINLLGKLHLAKGDVAAAEANFREARSLFLGAFGPDDPRVAMAESGLAQALSDQERPDEAKALLEHALPILEKSYGLDHERTRPARELFIELQTIKPE